MAAPVAPCLVVADGDAAVDFYRRAFAAVELFRATDATGTLIVVAALQINGGTVMLSDAAAAGTGAAGEATPADVGGRTTVCIHLAVADADAMWSRAIAAGAAVALPLADRAWGERFGKLRDPFGHVWSVGAPLPG